MLGPMHIFLYAISKFYKEAADEKEFVDICRYVECTGSAIQALMVFKKLYPGHRKKEIETFVAKATKFLEDTQYPNGGWCVPYNNPLLYKN